VYTNIHWFNTYSGQIDEIAIHANIKNAGILFARPVKVVP